MERKSNNGWLSTLKTRRPLNWASAANWVLSPSTHVLALLITEHTFSSGNYLSPLNPEQPLPAQSEHRVSNYSLILKLCCGVRVPSEMLAGRMEGNLDCQNSPEAARGHLEESSTHSDAGFFHSCQWTLIPWCLCSDHLKFSFIPSPAEVLLIHQSPIELFQPLRGGKILSVRMSHSFVLTVCCLKS